MQFKEWLTLQELKMKKLNRKEKFPDGVRDLQQDLSRDYVGHVARNGTVEPWKIIKPHQKLEFPRNWKTKY